MNILGYAVNTLRVEKEKEERYSEYICMDKICWLASTQKPYPSSGTSIKVRAYFSS